MSMSLCGEKETVYAINQKVMAEVQMVRFLISKLSSDDVDHQHELELMVRTLDSVINVRGYGQYDLFCT